MKNRSIIIVTGLSGSGKSTAINALEDAGYFCVDNMPVQLLPKFLELRSGDISEVQKLAFGMDLREKRFAQKYEGVFDELRKEGYRLEIIFLESSEEVLIKRYSETRRKHPVCEDGTLLDGIRAEKEQLKGLKKLADKVIDTSSYTVHGLKDLLIKHSYEGIDSARMKIEVISFGYKFGIPLEADILIDTRFIPNPFFVPKLKNLDGRDEEVKRFIKKWPETQDFMDKYLSLLDFLIPLYEKEGKAYLTVAVGCTGGKHRSVAIAEEINTHIKMLDRNTGVKHRDIEID
ncbi:MAG: RNase adapter RapZ [Deltaproteobacteria bacterium]|nr:RNase adapter RapZ [Deltaproteobacteria bacterium]